MTDHDIITYATMRKKAMEAAKYWKEWVYPATFDHTFPLPGVRVRMLIEKAESDQDTKPVFGVDEDERIAD